MFALRLGGDAGTSAAAGPSLRDGAGAFHTHVAFSFESAGRTDLLCVNGGADGIFSQVRHPQGTGGLHWDGLTRACMKLLCARAPHATYTAMPYALRRGSSRRPASPGDVARAAPRRGVADACGRGRRCGGAGRAGATQGP
jgi:hypothetical protein